MLRTALRHPWRDTIWRRASWCAFLGHPNASSCLSQPQQHLPVSHARQQLGLTHCCCCAAHQQEGALRRLAAGPPAGGAAGAGPAVPAVSGRPCCLRGGLGHQPEQQGHEQVRSQPAQQRPATSAHAADSQDLYINERGSLFFTGAPCAVLCTAAALHGGCCWQRRMALCLLLRTSCFAHLASCHKLPGGHSSMVD